MPRCHPYRAAAASGRIPTAGNRPLQGQAMRLVPVVWEVRIDGKFRVVMVGAVVAVALPESDQVLPTRGPINPCSRGPCQFAEANRSFGALCLPRPPAQRGSAPARTPEKGGCHLPPGVTFRRVSPSAGCHLPPGVTFRRVSPSAGCHLPPGVTFRREKGGCHLPRHPPRSVPSVSCSPLPAAGRGVGGEGLAFSTVRGETLFKTCRRSRMAASISFLTLAASCVTRNP